MYTRGGLATSLNSHSSSRMSLAGSVLQEQTSRPPFDESELQDMSSSSANPEYTAYALSQTGNFFFCSPSAICCSFSLLSQLGTCAADSF